MGKKHTHKVQSYVNLVNHGCEVWPFRRCHSDERAHSLSFTTVKKLNSLVASTAVTVVAAIFTQIVKGEGGSLSCIFFHPNYIFLGLWYRAMQVVLTDMLTFKAFVSKISASTAIQWRWNNPKKWNETFLYKISIPVTLNNPQNMQFGLFLL